MNKTIGALLLIACGEDRFGICISEIADLGPNDAYQGFESPAAIVADQEGVVVVSDPAWTTTWAVEVDSASAEGEVIKSCDGTQRQWVQASVSILDSEGMVLEGRTLIEDVARADGAAGAEGVPGPLLAAWLEHTAEAALGLDLESPEWYGLALRDGEAWLTAYFGDRTLPDQVVTVRHSDVELFKRPYSLQ